MSLKLLIDSCPDKRIIATGSSSFDLSGKITEPLTGRHYTRILFPLSIMEMSEVKGNVSIMQSLENFLVSERLKKQEYKKIYSNNYFWRTYSRQEIDLVEERDGKLFGFEFKWGKKLPRPPEPVAEYLR